jgi:putative ABC transport system permease protein
MTLRHSWRILWNAPRATTVIVLTLGVGMGLVITVFSLLNGYLWRALPYSNAERIVSLAEVDPSYPFLRRIGTLPGAAFQSLQAQATSYQQLAAYRSIGANLRAGTLARRVVVLQATPALLPMLGAAPYFGRVIEPGDAVAGAAPVVLLTHRLWRTDLAEDRAVLGRLVYIDGQAMTVAGVLPRSFEFEYADVWLPLRAAASDEWLHVLGRLNPDASVESARAELAVLEPRLRQAGTIAGDLMLHPEMVVRLPIPGALHWLFLFGTVFVLAIACANVVNLLLARGIARQSEFAVRVSLGANRARLLRTGLAESVLLVLMAVPIGLALSAWTIDILLVAIPHNLPSWIRFGIDLRVLGCTTLLAVAAVAMIGIAPARQAVRVDLHAALKIGGLVGSGSRRVARTTRRLIVLEVTLAVALCMGTLLLLRSAQRLSHVDPGYDVDRVLSVRFGLDARYAADAQQRAFFDRMQDRLQRTPGVEATSIESAFRYFAGDQDTIWRHAPVALAGTPSAAERFPAFRVVEPAFARVIGLRVLQGRFLDGGDRAGTELVVVLSRSLARRLAPEANPVGRMIVLDSTGTRSARVVGVLQDRVNIRFSRAGMRAQPEAELYLAAAQSMAEPSHTELLIRGKPVLIRGVVPEQLRAVDPDQVVVGTETLAERLDQSISITRVFAALFGVVAGCAFLLALIGLYGVVSYTAEQRRAEVGLRVALGATRRDIGKLVVGYGLGLTVMGVTLGIGLGFALNGMTRMLLFGVSTLDPLTCALVALLFSTVAILAAYAPARRAMNADPLNALRAQ